MLPKIWPTTRREGNRRAKIINGMEKNKKNKKTKKTKHTPTHCYALLYQALESINLPWMQIWRCVALYADHMVYSCSVQNGYGPRDRHCKIVLFTVVVSKGVGTSNESRTGANGIPYKLYNWVPATTSSAPNVSRTLRSWVAIQSVELTPDAIVVLLTIGQQSYIL